MIFPTKQELDAMSDAALGDFMDEIFGRLEADRNDADAKADFHKLDRYMTAEVNALLYG